jgi:hypothetical protein
LYQMFFCSCPSLLSYRFRVQGYILWLLSSIFSARSTYLCWYKPILPRRSEILAF